jgi:hypothetical protein
MEQKKTGLTQSAGYQIGVRCTLEVSLHDTWDLLLSGEGLEVWLGTDSLDKWETGIEFSSAEGISGSVRVFRVYSHIRISWKKKEWPNQSILQVRTIEAGAKTIISFHQEHLLNDEQREEMKEHWKNVLERIREMLESG